MSGPGLFVVGLLVTLIVAAALALLLYAAVLDGREANTRPTAVEPLEPAAVPDALALATVGGATAA